MKMSQYLTLTLQKITPSKLTTKSNPCIGIHSRLPSLFISCIMSTLIIVRLLVIKESHVYVSDDKKHDIFFVQHCLLNWHQIVDHGVRPQEHWVFLDGCACQFKGAHAMFFFAKYFGLTKIYKMKWQFFGTSHKKGNFKFIMSMQVHVVMIELQFCFVDLCACELMMQRSNLKCRFYIIVLNLTTNKLFCFLQ